jgi:phage gp29-like protein
MAKGGPRSEIYQRSQVLDTIKFLLDAPTFGGVKATIRAFTEGDVAESLQAFEEMEGKDERLSSVANTRRTALTRLDWRIVGTQDKQRKDREKQWALDAAEYTEQELTNLNWRDDMNILRTFDHALEWLSTGIGPNLSVVELVWLSTKLVKLTPVPGSRLICNPMDLGELRIITEDDMMGVPMPPDKFVVHRPQFRPGFAYSPGITYRLAFLWLMRRLALSDWSTFVSRFGIPMIWAVAKQGASDEEKTEIDAMLADFGGAGTARFTSNIEVSVLESSQRGTAPQEAFLNYLDRQMSIAWLGQALTTDTTGETGTLAAAEVHNQVRGDLLDSDIKIEAAMVKAQIIAPMCHYRWPGRDVPLPEFERIIPETIDQSVEADKMLKAQQLGVSIPRGWALERLGIPPVKDDEATLVPIAVNPLLEEGMPL